MKKLFYICAAVVAVACTKSEVAYEGGTEELAFSPVSYLSTKGAITDNVFPEDNHIALFAYHNPAQVATAEDQTVTDYAGFAANQYLNDTEFWYNEASPNDNENNKAWSGLNSIYYWPITGSLVFAGYSLPAPETAGTASPSIGEASYDLVEDVLKIEGYEQSVNVAETFDLLYFGRDGKSYNNRRTGTAVPVTFNHALAWITFNVKGGAGALVADHEWKIAELRLVDVNTKGNFTFNGTPAEVEKPINWELTTDVAAMPVFNENTPQQLTNAYARIENKVGDKYVDGVVVIPQSPKQLAVVLEYLSPAGDKITEEFDIDLTLGGAIWEAGKHYVYNLEFSPAEIKVAPEVTVWPTTGQEGYVEKEIGM